MKYRYFHLPVKSARAVSAAITPQPRRAHQTPRDGHTMAVELLSNQLLIPNNTPHREYSLPLWRENIRLLCIHPGLTQRRNNVVTSRRRRLSVPVTGALYS